MPLTIENKEPQQKKHGAPVKEELLFKIQNAGQELNELKQSNNLTIEEKNNKIEIIEAAILECSKELEILKTDTENLTDRTWLKYLESNIRNLEFEIENLKIYIEQQIKEEMESLNGIITEEKNIELEEKWENTNDNENISEWKLWELQSFENQCKDLEAQAEKYRELSHYHAVDVSNNTKEYEKVLNKAFDLQQKSKTVYYEILSSSDISEDINKATNLKDSIDMIIHEIYLMEEEIYNNISGLEFLKYEEEKDYEQEDPDIQKFNEISSFIENFDKINLSSWEDVYNDDRAKEVILQLLEYAGIPREEIQTSDDLKNLINQLEKLTWIHVKKIKNIYVTLANNLYRTNLQNLAQDIYLTALPTVLPERLYNMELGNNVALAKKKAFVCLECLERIGTLKEEELNEKYKYVYYKDLQALSFPNLSDLKKERNLDTISALEYANKYGKQAYESNMTHGVTYKRIRDEYWYWSNFHIYAPWAYEKLLDREKKYIDYIGYSLSEEDYNNLFYDFFDNDQGDVWNCYLISSIRNLGRTPYFDTLVRTSITHNADESYTIKLPLGEPGWIPYTIYKEEFNESSWRGPSLWYKLLEIAYVKYINGYNKITRQDIKETEAWTTAIALEWLLWREWYQVNGYTNWIISKTTVIKELKNFNPRRGDIITVSRWFPKKWVREDISPFHVYSLTDVVKDEKWNVIGVIIENPRSSHENYYVKIDELFDVAFRIECGHITDDFMDTKTSRWQKYRDLEDKAIHHFNADLKVPFIMAHEYIRTNGGFWKTVKKTCTTKEGLKDFWEWMYESLKSKRQHQKLFFENRRKTNEEALKNVREWADEKLNEAWEALSTVWKKASKILKNTWKKIWKAFSDAYNYLKFW